MLRIINTPYFSGILTSILAAGLLWLLVRVQKYGSGFWMNHRLKIAQEVAAEASKEAAALKIQTEEKQVALQSAVEKVLKTLTERNGGDNVLDYLTLLKDQSGKTESLLEEHTIRVKSALDDQTADVKGIIGAQVAKTGVALVEVAGRQEKFQNEVRGQLGDVNGLMVTLTNRVVKLTEKVEAGTETIKIVDAKITEDNGTVHGIGDTVGEIRATQKEQVDKLAG